MTDAQLIFILEKKFGGCMFQFIVFHENGLMEVSFFDTGGNLHSQKLHPDGTLTTLAV